MKALPTFLMVWLVCLRVGLQSAHVMAMAVQKLFPDAQVTIGPWIEKGFFYDFDMKEPFTEKDLKKIKKEMVSRRRTFMLGLHSFIRLHHHHHHHHHNRAGCYGSWSLKPEALCMLVVEQCRRYMAVFERSLCVTYGRTGS